MLDTILYYFFLGDDLILDIKLPVICLFKRIEIEIYKHSTYPVKMGDSFRFYHKSHDSIVTSSCYF